MNYSLNDSDPPLGGRKGKTCSMSGCNNTHQRFPNMSFFRFPKELSRFVILISIQNAVFTFVGLYICVCFFLLFCRAKEWLVICERPDLIRRVDIGDITINNYYVCEIHFPNQILDYATRKILIKTAKPLSMAELKALPAHHKRHVKTRRRSDDYDGQDEQDYDVDGNYEIEDSKGKHVSCVFLVNLKCKIIFFLRQFLFSFFEKMVSNLPILV